MDPRIIGAFRSRGIEHPHLHQTSALEAVRAGGDLSISTSTASGKSLCYQVPIVQSVIEDESARALLLYPTKALARDQLQAMRELFGPDSPLAGVMGVGPYDGDASPDERRAARSRAHAVASNPDMLHRSLLGDHGRWAQFIAGLRYIVVDEVHMYRGVFGSHVANVLRRLRRICSHHGSQPQFIACSATIANPVEHARALLGIDARSDLFSITQSTAPRGRRSFVILNPPVVDQSTGIRKNYVGVTRRATEILHEQGLATLAFCRTRKTVELLTRYLRETVSGGVAGPGDARGDGRRSLAWAKAASQVRGYRGGYLPERRREVESALRSGEARVVATTNALELGVDIGGLDAVVISGYPGTRAAVLQRSGRAGRRGFATLTVLCLSSSPLDQFVAASPEFVLGETVEHARIDPDNPEIVLPHLVCAAHELALSSDECPAGMAAADYAAAVAYLVERRVLMAETAGNFARGHEAAAEGDPCRQLFHHVGASSPADNVDIRGDIQENFAVVRDSPRGGHPGQILAEVDFDDAPLYLHVGAIYSVEGQTHEVMRLDWDARKAYVRVVDVDYYTEAVVKKAVRAIDGDCAPESADNDGSCGATWIHIRRQVPGFKKIRFGTHENIGFGPIALPDLELHTAGAYWQVPRAFEAAVTDPDRRAAAALAVAHGLHHVGAMLCMCDPSDLGHAVAAGEPGVWAEIVGARGSGATKAALLQRMAAGDTRIYVYDAGAGGSGLSTSLFDRGRAFVAFVARVMAGCGCPRGCPTCVGPDAWTGSEASASSAGDGRASYPGDEREFAAPLDRPRDMRANPREDALVLLNCLVDLIPQAADEARPTSVPEQHQHQHQHQDVGA